MKWFSALHSPILPAGFAPTALRLQIEGRVEVKHAQDKRFGIRSMGDGNEFISNPKVGLATKCSPVLTIYDPLVIGTNGE